MQKLQIFGGNNGRDIVFNTFEILTFQFIVSFE